MVSFQSLATFPTTYPKISTTFRPAKLSTMQELRRLMLHNTTPVYFVDWCLFMALGMEEYIGNLHFIAATDTFDGLHPQIYVPGTFEYDHSFTSEQTLNALLANREVQEFMRSKGGGKLLLWLFDDETERLAREIGVEICFPPAALRKHWDNKANTNRLAAMAGVPCVPYVLSPVQDYAHLRRLAAHLGEQLVVQLPHGMSGATTFFVSDEKDFDRHRTDITSGEEMKIMRRINCRSLGLDACVTRHGVVTSPLLIDLVGIPELTLYAGGWCGNEMFPNAFPDYVHQQARLYAEKMGEQLRLVGYNGYFEPDFLFDLDDGTLYLGEINMRFSGFTPVVNNIELARNDVPLMLLHLAEWMDMPYQLDVKALNDRWSDPANTACLSFLHFKNVTEELAQPKRSGIYRMTAEGSIVYDRPATNLSTLQGPEEIFWLSTAGKQSRIEKGDEIGGMFIRERVTTDGKKLTEKARAWVDGIKVINQQS